MATKAAKSALDASMRIVVLHGKEGYLVAHHTRTLAHCLEERFGGLETFTFEGETAAPAAVLDELRSYGLMQRHKLVIVDNADEFLADSKTGDDDEAEALVTGSAKSRKLLERYAESPVEDATLLLRGQSWRAGNLDKLISKVGTIIKCEQPRQDQAVTFCVKRAEKEHATLIDAGAAQLLVQRIGPDLQRLDTELSKLAAMAGEGQPITRELVAGSVGLSREEKAWEIQSAIITGDASAMLCKLRELLTVSRQDVVPIAWAVCDLLRKLHAASRMLRQRASAGEVIKHLRLWGDGASATLDLARRLDPENLAQLLHAAIEVDAQNKSGMGDPQRNLEALMVRIADTVNA